MNCKKFIHQKLLIATFNQGKFREYKIIINEILKLPLKLISLKSLKIKEKVEETGKSYEENAILKAKFYCKISGIPTLADDSGLEIDVLDGWPGIKSRRDKNGKELSDKELIKTVMEKLKGVPFEKRKARYRAVAALALPDKKKIYTFEGKREGFIAGIPSRKIWKGFPFDSIFYLPEKKNVFVNMTPKEKAKFSHRLEALKKALPFLKKISNLKN
jgi:XTP/dITP diphosphohydrolase